MNRGIGVTSKHFTIGRSASTLEDNFVKCLDVTPSPCPAARARTELEGGTTEESRRVSQVAQDLRQGAQDPRKAWIELDSCVAIAREDPSEARRVFAEVKKRTPRVKALEKTYK